MLNVINFFRSGMVLDVATRLLVSFQKDRRPMGKDCINYHIMNRWNVCDYIPTLAIHSYLRISLGHVEYHRCIWKSAITPTSLHHTQGMRPQVYMVPHILQEELEVFPNQDKMRLTDVGQLSFMHLHGQAPCDDFLIRIGWNWIIDPVTISQSYMLLTENCKYIMEEIKYFFIWL